MCRRVVRDRGHAAIIARARCAERNSGVTDTRICAERDVRRTRNRGQLIVDDNDDLLAAVAVAVHVNHAPGDDVCAGRNLRRRVVRDRGHAAIIARARRAERDGGVTDTRVCADRDIRRTRNGGQLSVQHNDKLLATIAVAGRVEGAPGNDIRAHGELVRCVVAQHGHGAIVRGQRSAEHHVGQIGEA